MIRPEERKPPIAFCFGVARIAVLMLLFHDGALGHCELHGPTQALFVCQTHE
jgi:hypothetical protein